MRSLNPNIFPKDGYLFVNSDGARIFGDTWRGVEARVRKYRERAGQPVGDVWAEVVAQVCAREPVLCVDENAAYHVELKKSSLKGRVVGWLNRIRGLRDEGQLQFVADADRNARVNVCAACPHNQALPGGCASCKAAVDESRRNLIGSRAVDARMNACELLGEDISTAVWVEQITDENPALPGHCWRKRTL